MVAFQVPHDPNRAQLISSAQMQNLFHRFGECLVRHLMRNFGFFHRRHRLNRNRRGRPLAAAVASGIRPVFPRSAPRLAIGVRS